MRVLSPKKDLKEMCSSWVWCRKRLSLGVREHRKGGQEDSKAEQQVKIRLGREWP